MTETDAFLFGPGNGADALSSPGIPGSGVKG